MDIWHVKLGRLRRDEGGFTLPELLTTIAILGILIAIAIVIWNNIAESRRVDAAANQLASDLRLAHTRATNQLTDWRIVVYPERGDDEDCADTTSGCPDYYLVRLSEPYGDEPPDPSGPSVDIAEDPPIKRTLPENVEIMNETSASGVIIDTPASPYYYNPEGSGDIRTMEFNSDGAMLGYGSPSGTLRVTIDGDPQRSIGYQSATSRIELD